MVNSLKEYEIVYWIDDNNYRVGRMTLFQLELYLELVSRYWKSNK